MLMLHTRTVPSSAPVSVNAESWCTARHVSAAQDLKCQMCRQSTPVSSCTDMRNTGYGSDMLIRQCSTGLSCPSGKAKPAVLFQSLHDCT